MAKSMGYSKKKATAKKKAPAIKVAQNLNMSSKKEQLKWQAEDDARTLMRAEEIKRDASRIKAAQAQAKRQIEELAQVVKK